MIKTALVKHPMDHAEVLGKESNKSSPIRPFGADALLLATSGFPPMLTTAEQIEYKLHGTKTVCDRRLEKILTCSIG